MRAIINTSTNSAAGWLREYQSVANRQIRGSVVAGTLAGAAAIVQLGMMAALAHQALVVEAPVSDWLPWLAGIIVALLARGAALAVQGRLSAMASRHIRALLRRNLLQAVRARGPVALADTSSGTLASEWLEQVDALHGYYAHFLPQTILCVSVPLMILAVTFWLDWLAALFLLLSAPLIPLFMALVGMGAERLNQQHMRSLGRLSGLFLDRIRGLTTLQLYQRTGAATADIHWATDHYRRINLKTLRVAFLSSAVLEFFASVAIAVIAIYVGFGLLGYIDYGPSDQLTLFSGLFVLLLAPEFFQPLRQLAQHYHDRATALGAASQLAARLGSAPPKEASAAAPDQSRGDRPAVQVDGLTVIYPGDRRALDSVSFAVEAGEFVAIRGPSGSGKSTLLQALAGFLPSASGTATVLGQEPGALPLGWLGQTPYLRQDSWAGNLRLAAPDASDAELMDALEQVGLAHVVRGRPEGLNAPISEEGVGLSGGQARRLALARIFLARYPLILMDEPTAGLDRASEDLVIAAIRALRRDGSTLVVVSHHPAVMEAADRCLNMERGRLC
ncbi:ATP-binding cassette, subfamily C, CydD [Marinobacter daqiaonensis]|uniref:ATP-binding cassette, subfamily C, CydD n=1 Tax=Marinobacter daqiaonensis TaxID=650891 RepID=A0A1I6GTA9_9GAMM|nr:thiol reductant ABC exporter subunit CydD [Marinobacter daqiaonensis]SFR45277.1 ATP-binding cassette, subfamily C, CydD [Marinobacter daqiaonensis]